MSKWKPIIYKAQKKLISGTVFRGSRDARFDDTIKEKHLPTFIIKNLQKICHNPKIIENQSKNHRKPI